GRDRRQVIKARPHNRLRWSWVGPNVLRVLLKPNDRCVQCLRVDGRPRVFMWSAAVGWLCAERHPQCGSDKHEGADGAREKPESDPSLCDFCSHEIAFQSVSPSV